jgi:phosphatidylserine/phosphatidylglycerophosphate/cardiolipin synthase-like enzyme
LLKVFLFTGMLALLAGCASSVPPSSDSYIDGIIGRSSLPGLPEKTILADASTPAQTLASGVMLTNNDQAFTSKLNMVKSARQSIDLAYYIYSDDYSSSALSYELIEAARRGVRVRMLLDYHTNYKHLDMFSMMQTYGNSGAGSLEVRFYNRPTKNMIKDAVYLTLGCGDVQNIVDLSSCSGAKYNQIERMFASETIDGTPVGQRNISNLNIANSGLFLSGLYGKYPPLIALAVTQGQDIDRSQLAAARTTGIAPADALELGRLYWLAETSGPFGRIANQVRLAFALQMYSEQVNPIVDSVKSYAPAQRLLTSEGALRDWDYLTDFLHHKLLLVDEQQVQLGGRNVEDSYHMVPNPLTDKYIFMDTDVYLRLDDRAPALTQSFVRLWNFEDMVATIDDIRQHAPNDFLIATRAAKQACADREGGNQEAYLACQQQVFAQAQSVRLDQRMEAQYQQMLRNREIYLGRYRSGSSAGPEFIIDPGSRVYYIENLPFDGSNPRTKPARHYGSVNGRESEYGKHIHELWIEALRHACEIATAEQPQRVLMHNAYFFLPSNVLRQLGAMVDGTLDCRYVTVAVLTNSIQTTDLNVVNLAARQSIKAFVDYKQQAGDPQRSANFVYYEYRPQSLRADGRPDQSLHTKVMIFGPDIYVGSANADIRSYMMDSNNGFYITGAPDFVAGYTRWLDSLMNDPSRTFDSTGYFATVSRQQMQAEDLEVLRALLQRYGVDRYVSNPVQTRQLETYYLALLNTIYELSLGSLQPGRAGSDPQADLNAYFKPI